MVKINRQLLQLNRLRQNPKTPFYALLGAVVLSTVALIFDNSGTTSEASLLRSSGRPATTSAFAAENARKLKAWRQNLRDKCAAAQSQADVLAISDINKEGFVMPAVKRTQPRGDSAVVRCRSVVMDFGANIGDTSGHVIDAGLIGCERADLGPEAKTLPVHYNTESKQFEELKKRNPLTANLVRLMSDFGATVGPEDYCYYGIEGNPVFTKRLQDIEDYVMEIRPRPIQHMHFFTESVGAGKDGMTKLYLDTVNTKQNFWGSSIFAGHQDVRKSAQESNTTVDTIAADVMGYTIGTLMRKTLKVFDADASPEEKKGNHLVLKVDIEGGEYPLLSQAAEEGTLCEFVKMGNQADLFIEFHSMKVTGKHDYGGKTKEIKDKLTGCGVTFRNLAAWWA